jgi:hypothetical protein
MSNSPTFEDLIADLVCVATCGTDPRYKEYFKLRKVLITGGALSDLLLELRRRWDAGEFKT